MEETERITKPILDIILNNLDENPKCPHGPMLLFIRQNQKFYSCSACRDRKLCPFYIKYGEKTSQAHENAVKTESLRLRPRIGLEHLRERAFNAISLGQRVNYCHSCELLVLKEDSTLHNGHDVTLNIQSYHLTHPSELLKPSEQNKKEAQYLFSSKSVEVIVKAIKKNHIFKVLCIGTPRVHEFILNNTHLKMKSLLLDIDTRYHNFYTPDKFCWYNSFNNFFFESNQIELVLKPFLRNEKIALIMDPPFGGRLEPLGYTINQLRLMHEDIQDKNKSEQFYVIFISPYFMEFHLEGFIPNLRMVDYKVCYDNHQSFSKGLKARKLGSPVRIFTNIPLDKFPLPKEEGYWFCIDCMKWSSKENKHCPYCSCCTSKNGCTYVHCFECKKCVKPSWKHCDTCKRCCLASHICKSFKPVDKCYRCGEQGHKKYNCPLKLGEQTAKKNEKMKAMKKLQTARRRSSKMKC